MNPITVSESEPAEWPSVCAEHNALFGSRTWQDLLERSFRCRTLYCTSEDGGVVATVFKAGPFDVGYCGFPSGSSIGTMVPLLDACRAIKNAANVGKPTCLRVPVSAFGDAPELQLPAQRNPETAIPDLPAWSLDAVSKNLRRDIRKVERSGVQVNAQPDEQFGERMYAMYESTVARAGGNLRYTPAYFREVLRLFAKDRRLRVLEALVDGQSAGFLVTAQHGRITYYLHGGAHPNYRRYSPSDMLLASAIELARQDGSLLFNLMASPTDQPSLVRYKEKWGGETRELLTYTFPVGGLYPVFRLAERLRSRFG